MYYFITVLLVLLIVLTKRNNYDLHNTFYKFLIFSLFYYIFKNIVLCILIAFYIFEDYLFILLLFIFKGSNFEIYGRHLLVNNF